MYAFLDESSEKLPPNVNREVSLAGIKIGMSEQDAKTTLSNQWSNIEFFPVRNSGTEGPGFVEMFGEKLDDASFLNSDLVGTVAIVDLGEYLRVIRLLIGPNSRVFAVQQALVFPNSTSVPESLRETFLQQFNWLGLAREARNTTIISEKQPSERFRKCFMPDRDRFNLERLGTIRPPDGDLHLTMQRDKLRVPIIIERDGVECGTTLTFNNRSNIAEMWLFDNRLFQKEMTKPTDPVLNITL